MAKKSPIVAKKHQFHDLQMIGWSPLGGSRIVYHGIKSFGKVETIDGDMIKVQIYLDAEFENPITDIAALVGKVCASRPYTVSSVPITTLATDASAYVKVAEVITESDYNFPAPLAEFARTELWYWNDKFYVKAHDGTGVEWYKNRCFLFYEVNIAIPPGFIEAQTAARETAEAARIPII